MVAGWAPGQYMPTEGSFVVRDRDRHGWTQVYFPNYGWIDIEVTPGRSLDPRGQEVATVPEPDIDRLIGGGAFDEDLLLQDIEETEAAARAALAGFPVDASGGFRVPVELYFALASLGGLFIVMYAGWRVAHAGLDPATRSYTQMVRAGWLLGMPRSKDQTPAEYAREIGDAAPRAGLEAGRIATVYERLVYAHRKPEKAEEAAVDRAWGRVFRGMLGYRISRLGRRLTDRRRAPA
jgi:hypothetical protein